MVSESGNTCDPKQDTDMKHLERRIRKAERQIQGDDDDEIVTIDLGTGQSWQMTMGQWRRIFRELDGTRHLPVAFREDNQSV